MFAHAPASAYTDDSIKAQQMSSENNDVASENGFPGPKRPAEQALQQPSAAKKVLDSVAVSIEHLCWAMPLPHARLSTRIVQWAL